MVISVKVHNQGGVIPAILEICFMKYSSNYTQYCVHEHKCESEIIVYKIIVNIVFV